MAKKSTATRQANAARRSQSMSRAPEVTLVRQPKTATGQSGEAPAAKAAPTASASSAKQVVIGGTRQRVPAVTKTPTARPVSPKPENAARTPGKTQTSRVARAQTSQRVRNVSRVSPEQYGYVKKDLRFIGILAASMFLVIIALSFVLPRLLPQ